MANRSTAPLRFLIHHSHLLFLLFRKIGDVLTQPFTVAAVFIRERLRVVRQVDALITPDTFDQRAKKLIHGLHVEIGFQRER